MELWIRSQDKNRLFMAENLYIDEFYQVVGYKTKEQKTVSGIAIWHNEKIIAKYDTRERCLEILDEIQEMIDNAPILVKNMNELSKEDIERALSLSENVRTVFYNDDFYPLKTILYQMPEK